LRWLTRKLPRNNQKGFTLIELLVVISILGILAAVVTMSMVGITNQARNRAAATEKATVQTAYDTMLQDQQVPPTHECDNAGAGIGDMTQFPVQLPYQFDATGQDTLARHAIVALAPHYLHQQTHGTYSCGAGGVINQDSYNP
jgi:prepilin-type N-terminal cleavage/methylation domain-containing protein